MIVVSDTSPLTNLAAIGQFDLHTVQNRALVTALQRDLDRGEAETIVLALELGADLTLLDEKEGRHAARRWLSEPRIWGCGLAWQRRYLASTSV